PDFLHNNHAKMRMLSYRLFLVLTTLSVLLSVIALAQPNKPTPVPDRVILNLTADPSSSVAVTWRTDTTVNASFVELQPAIPLVDINKTSSLPATTITRKYIWGEEPEVISNHHSCIIDGL